MKTTSLFLILLFSATSSFAQNKMSLVGTWKLISGKMMYGDSTYPFDNKTLDAIKIVTPTHFAVISQYVSDSSLEHAASGTVQMDDKNYTEQYMYGSFKEFTGKALKFTYRIEGDKWYYKGGIENMIWDEVWQRVK